jgi:hypothetical protein
MPRARRDPATRDRPTMTSLEIPADLKAGLDLVKLRDGVPQSEQIRRAIRAWLEGREAIEPQEPPQGARVPAKRTTRRGGTR